MARSNLVQRDAYDATFPPVSSRAPRLESSYLVILVPEKAEFSLK